MLDLLNLPWKNKDVPVTVILRHIQDSDKFERTFNDVNPDSITESPLTFSFKNSFKKPEPGKTIRHIRFPLRYIKYYDFAEVYANPTQEYPSRYTLTFHVQFENDNPLVDI